MKRVCVFVFFFCISSAALALPCAKQQEMEAIRIRALQTELMFAALSCNGQTHYNSFVKQYRSELQDYAQALRSYFTRAYGAKKAEKEMNHFVTRLANESSTRSLKQGAKRYCSAARKWFSEVEDGTPLHAANFSYKGEIRSCTQ